MDTARLETENGGLEESLGGAETLVANGDDLTVRKLVRLLKRRALGSSLNLLLKIKSDVAELLLDVTNDFTLGGGGEGVTTLSKDLHQVVGKITTSHVDTGDGVRKSETLVDGDNVGDTITRVEDDTGGTARGVEGEDGLDGDVEGGGVERLKDNLGHLLTVGLGVDGGLGEEDGVLLRGDTELVVEGVVPNLLHVVPVGDDTVLNGVAEGEDTTLGLSLVTDVGVLLAHTNHDTMVTGTTDNGRENSSGRIITGETGLAHAGTIVDDEGSNFFLHSCELRLVTKKRVEVRKEKMSSKDDDDLKSWMKRQR